ncbi:hypothetical protein PRIPAC_84801 [Pristionchus pacificus]|uniref:Uncharacterized protein n=1 Tax=Pristionchus pacificus TaxID=54126 RepID=A0A2A6BKX7_PRIPA|nr:hypothetical protein PRIPAC_84801 [Pristionchus pacificus]|eukprot:PDM66547.1 hypothetical protein PRIPAC_47964 [Pristionchus pacificus]
MQSLVLFTSFTLLILLHSTYARIEPVRYFSDPTEVLMRDSLRVRSSSPYYSYRPSRNAQWKTVTKRRFNAYPPSFYTYNSYPLNFNRRSAAIPYADLLFSGR